MPQIVVRYGETDQDLVMIHRFLLIVAAPAMRCPVNIEKSLMEIVRVAKEGVALMVFHNDVLVGTMGVISPDWWYGDAAFMCDRWHFVLPAFQHGEAAKELEAEAVRIADAAGLEFIHFGKIRGKRKGMARMMPRVLNGD